MLRSDSFPDCVIEMSIRIAELDYKLFVLDEVNKDIDRSIEVGQEAGESTDAFLNIKSIFSLIYFFSTYGSTPAT